MKIKEITEKALQLLFLLFLIYLAFELLRKILGGSLGFEELTIALLVAILGHSFYTQRQIGKIDSKLSGHIGWHKSRDNNE